MNLEVREIPVEYTAVDKEVPALWNEIKPKVINFTLCKGRVPYMGFVAWVLIIFYNPFATQEKTI